MKKRLPKWGEIAPLPPDNYPLSIRQVSVITGISRSYLYSIVAAGRLETYSDRPVRVTLAETRRATKRRQ